MPALPNLIHVRKEQLWVAIRVREGRLSSGGNVGERCNSSRLGITTAKIALADDVISLRQLTSHEGEEIDEVGFASLPEVVVPRLCRLLTPRSMHAHFPNSLFTHFSLSSTLNHRT